MPPGGSYFAKNAFELGRRKGSVAQMPYQASETILLVIN